VLSVERHLLIHFLYVRFKGESILFKYANEGRKCIKTFLRTDYTVLLCISNLNLLERSPFKSTQDHCLKAVERYYHLKSNCGLRAIPIPALEFYTNENWMTEKVSIYQTRWKKKTKKQHLHQQKSSAIKLICWYSNRKSLTIFQNVNPLDFKLATVKA